MRLALSRTGRLCAFGFGTIAHAGTGPLAMPTAPDASDDLTDPARGGRRPRPEEGDMVECPRCGHDAELVAGEAFVLVWCELCTDLIEVGDLDLQPSPPHGRTRPWRRPAHRHGVVADRLVKRKT
jgi:hypothetical protein